MAGARIGRTLFVAGGQQTMTGATPTRSFFSLDLSGQNQPKGWKWEVLPAWPGPARVVPVAAAQWRGPRECFFLFSGRTSRPSQATDILTDAYAFDPVQRTWTPLANVSDSDGRRSVMAGVAVAVGREQILLLGACGDTFLRLEQLDLQIADLRRLRTAAAALQEELQHEIDQRPQEQRTIYETHPGFSREVLAYNTCEYTWRVAAQSPVPTQLTTTPVQQKTDILIPRGHAVRTTRITVDAHQTSPPLAPTN